MAGRYALAIVQWALSFGTVPIEQGHKEGIRLPGDIKPLAYELGIRTDLEEKRFWGAEIITIETQRKTHSLKLHAGCNLDISLLRICLRNRQCVDVDMASDRVERDCIARTVTVDTEWWHTFVKQEEFYLIMKWESEINPSPGGYMLSPDIGFSTPGFSAVTRFEPVEARNAFPSFDEPAPKATWGMTMIGRNGTVNLANMDVKLEKPLYGNTKLSVVEHLLTEGFPLDGTWKSTEFHQTPKMSPNNVAWGNGRFNSIESSYKSEKLNKTIPTAVYINYADPQPQSWLLTVMDTVMPIYESIFNLAYPLPKLFWMATPAFTGGIEHWGLITGGSESTKWDEKRGAGVKAGITSFASHEIAHQWFANIVTMEWWDDLWLNEAFASYAADWLMGPLVDPDFLIWKPFADNFRTSMAIDAQTSHAIITPITEEAQFGTAFDAITYQKGASVLRMIASVSGEKAFLKGVSKYLNKFAYDNAVGQDLWNEVAKRVNGVDISAFADAWTKQPGFPVVYVEKIGENTFRLTQERYFTKGPAASKGNKQTWPIPLFAIPAAQETSTTLIMNTTSMELTISGTDQLVLNRDQLGYYRVQYDDAGYAWMRDHFTSRSPSLPPADRGAFLMDMAAFAASGRAPTIEVLELLQHVTGETDISVWSTATSFLLSIRSVLFEAPSEEQLAIKDFAAKVIVDTYGTIGLFAKHNESATDAKIRQLILPLAGRAGVPAFVEEAGSIFTAIAGRDGKVFDGLTEQAVVAIMETAVMYGGNRQWLMALRLYHRDEQGPYASAALSAVCSSQDPVIINGVIDMLKDGSLTSDPTKKLMILVALASSPAARRSVVNFVLENADEIIGGADNLGRDRILPAILSGLTSEKDIAMIKERFSGDRYKGWQAGLNVAIETIQGSVDWLARDGENIKKWLSQQE